MSGVLGTLAGASGGILGSLGSIFSRNSNNKAIARENRIQREFAHNEALLAHERQLEIMDKQNDWNSFGNQRKLAEDAGFNPNMIFGQGGSAGIATSSGASGGAQANTPSVGYPDSVVDPAAIGALSDAALKAAQVRNIDADTDLKRGETAGVSLSNTYQNMVNELFKKYGERKEILGINRAAAETVAVQVRTSIDRVNEKLAKYDLDMMKPAEFSKIAAEISLDSMLESESLSRHDLNEAQLAWVAKLNAAIIAKYYADARASNSSADLSDSIASSNRFDLSLKQKLLGDPDSATSVFGYIIRDFREDLIVNYEKYGLTLKQVERVKSYLDDFGPWMEFMNGIKGSGIDVSGNSSSQSGGLGSSFARGLLGKIIGM